MTTDYIEAGASIRRAIADLKKLPPARNVSLAITNAEQALMWLGFEQEVKDA